MYVPTSLNDIIFGNPESKLRIYDIVTGAETLPASGKSGILLYGTWGTGKTTMATMLPDAIEKGRTDEELTMSADLIRCQQGFNGPQVIDFIAKILDKNSLNASGLHYIIIDEVDLLTKSAQESLKSAMNTSRCIFILTTNYIAYLDRGLLDRCVLVEMNAAAINDYLPLAKNLVSDMGVVMSDDDLLPTISAAKGSLRNLIHNVERLARRSNPPPPNIIF
ncbi:HolB ATPase involved in DNA replication [Burkholderiaceae bacterium]|jgi:DNA polymerase III delta prime subunit